MKLYMLLLLFVTPYYASAEVQSDLSTGFTIGDTNGESVSNYRLSSTYFTDYDISYGASLSYLDFKQDVQDKLAGELFVAPYLKTDKGHIISSELGFRSDAENYFLGFSTRIHVNNSIYLLTSVRWYSNVSSSIDDEFFDFSLGVSYDWSSSSQNYGSSQRFTIQPTELVEQSEALDDVKEVEVITHGSNTANELREILETAYESELQVYYLKKGDYLYKIARQNGITFKQLVDLNARFPSIENLNLVYPGMKIYLPPEDVRMLSSQN